MTAIMAILAILFIMAIVKMATNMAVISVSAKSKKNELKNGIKKLTLGETLRSNQNQL